MTNSGFFQLFDRHEREDYNATLSEAAIRQMISEEFEEADKIIAYRLPAAILSRSLVL